MFKQKDQGMGGGGGPKRPEFQPSAIYYGGKMMGRTYMDPKLGFVSQYYPNKNESRQKQIMNQRINALLPSLGQSAPDVAARFDQMRDDYVGKQTDAFSKQYQKTLDNLREDIGSRFGTLKASPYFDRMQQLYQDVWNPAILDIQRQGSIFRTDLDNQEQQRKLRELSALGFGRDADRSNLLQVMQNAMQGGQLLNQFNQNNYMYDLQKAQMDAQSKQSGTNGFLGFLGGLF